MLFRSIKLFEDGKNNTNDKVENETKSEAEDIVPKYSAKVLVDKIISTYRSKYSKDATAEKAIKSSIQSVINDTTLDYSYRYQVRVYATALGYKIS